MKKSTKYILGGVGVLGLMVVAVVGYGFYKIYSFATMFGVERDTPAALKEPRVTTGADFLRRTDFFKLEKSGYLETIASGSTISDDKERDRHVKAKIAADLYNFADLKVVGDEIIAAGKFGAFVFDSQGNLKSYATFEPSTEKIKIGPLEHETRETDLSNLQVVRLDRDRIGYLSFDLTRGVRVYDAKGNVIWSIGKETTDLGDIIADNREEKFDKASWVLEAAVGDLDGDGRSEYIVARKNDGIRVYDQSGKERWFHADAYPNGKLDVVDLDGDGKGELVSRNNAIFASNGIVIRELKSGGHALVVAEAKDKKLGLSYVDIYSGKLSYKSEDGETVMEADAPLSHIPKAPERVEVPGEPEMAFTDDSDSVAFPKAVLVSLRKDQPKYLAVVAAFIGLPRANFYVYDHNGKLVYHELLPEETETIAVVRAGDGVESILLAGKDTIWKYTVN